MNKLLLKQVINEIIKDEKECNCKSHQRFRADEDLINKYRDLMNSDAGVIMILGTVGRLCARDPRTLAALSAQIFEEK